MVDIIIMNAGNLKDSTMFLYLVLLTFLTVEGGTKKLNFRNYKVIRTLPIDDTQLLQLQNLVEEPHGLSFWNDPETINTPVDVVVPPRMLPAFRELANSMNITSEEIVEDVQQLIDQENSIDTGKLDSYDWDHYYPLENIYDWLDSLVQAYPDKVSPIIGGSTYEGRQIKGVKLSYKTGNRGVFVEGGIHAREWIAPSTVTYILNQLLTSNDTEVRDIAENYDWYIFPVVNPDGYVYSHTTDRLWRKTRSKTSEKCFGVDPNRNWDFHWKDGGSSDDPCHLKYAGDKPFSEIETRSLSQYILSIEDKFDIYIAFHSYSQMLLIPYGHSNETICNYDSLMEIGKKAMQSLARRYGTEYQVGNIVDLLFPASGGSVDWIRGVLRKPITFTYELRDKDSFILPADQIIPTGEETLDSVVTILQEARKVTLKTLDC